MLGRPFGAGKYEPPIRNHSVKLGHYLKLTDYRFFKSVDASRGACYHQVEFAQCNCQMNGHNMSDFGLCATDVREPRQVRKEATVTSLSVCRRSPEV